MAGTVFASPVAQHDEAQNPHIEELKQLDISNFDLIPGPGMPSLESVGLTKEALYNKTFVSELLAPVHAQIAGKSPLTARQWTSQCQRNWGVYGIVDSLNACAAYLYALGTQWCTVQNGQVWRFCTIPYGRFTTVVEGVSIANTATTSFCQHVSTGPAWVAQNCVAGCEEHCGAAGSAHAWGNGYLVTRNYGAF